MEITLAKALKIKNKLATELKELYARLHTNNVYESNVNHYNTDTILSDIDIKIKEITKIKTAIHSANTSVHHKIFRLSELKGFLSQLKHMNVTVSEKRGYGMRNMDDSTKYIIQMDGVTRDKEVKMIQEEIEIIQDELDEFNHSTKIYL